MRTLTLSEVIEILKIGFGSFEAPDYARVESWRESPVISNILAEFENIADYKDISDSNDDVSVILSSENLPYLIYLSLVGKVAFIDGDPNTSPEIYNNILLILSKYNWELIDEKVLRSKSPFPTFIAGNNATIFNALFADGYTTP